MSWVRDQLARFTDLIEEASTRRNSQAVEDFHHRRALDFHERGQALIAAGEESAAYHYIRLSGYETEKAEQAEGWRRPGGQRP